MKIEQMEQRTEEMRKEREELERKNKIIGDYEKEKNKLKVEKQKNSKVGKFMDGCADFVENIR